MRLVADGVDLRVERIDGLGWRARMQRQIPQTKGHLAHQGQADVVVARTNQRLDHGGGHGRGG